MGRTGSSMPPRRRAVRPRAVLAPGVALVALLLTGAGCGGPSAPPPAPPATGAQQQPSSAAPTPTAVVSPSAGPTPSPSPSSPAPAPSPTGHQRLRAMRTDVGRMVWTTLSGPRSGVQMRVWVWLPPQYDQPAYAHTAFPALMLFPGGSGAGYNTWVGEQYGARQLVARDRHVTPFVFVMPEMQLSERLDTECADLPGQPKVGTFLAVDVRRMVEDNFRVMRDRSGWGAAGASSGAYCATRLVFNHPDQYRAVVSIAGYYRIQTGLRGGKDPKVLATDPAVIARRDPPDVAVQLWTGDRNPYDLEDARRFLALLRPPTKGSLEVQRGGGHLTSDFAKMMPSAFAFLSRTLAAPAPS